MSRLIPGALQHVSGAPGGPASGPATPTTNKPDDSRENSVLTRQSQPMGALVGGVVCTVGLCKSCCTRARSLARTENEVGSPRCQLASVNCSHFRTPSLSGPAIG